LFLYFSTDEISRQIINSEAKFVITTINGHSTIYEALKLAKLNLPIVCIRTEKEESLPNGAISFEEIMNPKGQ
jgi:hypothetical protein